MQMTVAHTIFYLGAIEPAQQERAGGSSAPDEALDTVVEHLVKQPEPEYILRCLIVFADAAVSGVRCPYPMLSQGFLCMALSLPSGLFNHAPQCGGFGLTSAGAYTFLGNVVR